MRCTANVAIAAFCSGNHCQFRISQPFSRKLAFDTSHFASMLKDRLFGAANTAFAFQPHRGVAIDSLSQLTPSRYLTTPGLWIGLAFAAAFVAIAVRQRRYRGPI